VAGVAAYLVGVEELAAELARADEPELHAVLGQSGRLLSEAAAAALCDAIRQAGTPLGAIDVPPELEDRFPPWAARWFPRLIGVPDAADRALSGGFLELRGSGRHELGALPVDLLRSIDWMSRTWSPDEHEELHQLGPAHERWAEQLLSLLREAQRQCTERGPPADTTAVVFVPQASAPVEPTIAKLLECAVETRASDLLLTTGRPPLLRIAGRSRALDVPPLTPEQTQRLGYTVLTDAQVRRLERDQALRVSFGVRGLGRFRATLVLERGAVAASLRCYTTPPALDALGLPAGVVEALVAPRAGLVVVCGPAGSGRTTTAAALVAHHVAAGRHALTLEEPIELILGHGEGGGVVQQLELGPDALSLGDAQDVARDLVTEVVLLDRVDERPRLEAALTLAAQGRLVVTTLAALDATDAIARLLALGGEPWRAQLLRHLQVVVSQRLVARQDDVVGRTPEAQLQVLDAAARDALTR
jgi:twitching motility protein PilT